MLMLAISNDSQFLSTNLVMDYSLLVGLDEQRKELVIGIIGEVHEHNVSFNQKLVFDFKEKLVFDFKEKLVFDFKEKLVFDFKKKTRL